MDMKIELIICLTDHTWFLHNVRRSDLDFLVGDGEFNPENPDHVALIKQLLQGLDFGLEIAHIAHIGIYSYENVEYTS